MLALLRVVAAMMGALVREVWERQERERFERWESELDAADRARRVLLDAAARPRCLRCRERIHDGKGEALCRRCVHVKSQALRRFAILCAHEDGFTGPLAVCEWCGARSAEALAAACA